MQGPAALPAATPPPLPRWWPWLFLLLLAVPLHPYWLDFEAARRGLLLCLCGATLLLRPRLPRAGGEGWLWALLALLALSWLVQAATCNPWQAQERLLHVLALVLLLRLGALAALDWWRPICWLLLLASGLGLLQRLGLAACCGYGIAEQPVSLFGNLNVAAEVVAVAGAAAVAAFPTRPRLCAAALAGAAAYLVLNGSRSGLVALPLALGFTLLVRSPRRPALLALAATALGALVGAFVDALGPAPKTVPVEPQATALLADRSTTTLDVRREIHRGALALLGEAPWLGHGPGQFAIQYPRHRSQQEIELSSLGRQFATEVRTAHDDWIELGVEGGVLAPLLWLGLLWRLWRLHRGDVGRLAPLVALAALMFVRAPFGNAPAIAIALLCVATTREAPPQAALWRWGWRLLGLCLVVLGSLPVLSQTLFAPYQAARAELAAGDPVWLVRAAAVWPGEPRYLQLLAQEHLAAGRLDDASRAAARAAALRPHEPSLLLLLATIRAQGGDLRSAEQLGRYGLSLDPGNPELRVLLSTVWLQGKLYDDAVQVVYEHLHERLAARLAAHFHELEQLAARRNDPVGAGRCAAERAFLQAWAALPDRSPAGLERTGAMVKNLPAVFRLAGIERTDLRWLVVSALHALDLDQGELAAELGEAAARLERELPNWQLQFFGAQLEPLRRIGSWRRLLP